MHVGGGGRAERSRPAASRAGRDRRAATAEQWRPERAQAALSAGSALPACVQLWPAVAEAAAPEPKAAGHREERGAGQTS